MGHRGIGQALGERCLQVETNFARGLFEAFQCDGVRDPDTGGTKLGRGTTQAKLLFDLRPRAMNDNDAHPHRREQRDVIHKRIEPAGDHKFAREGDHEGFAPKCVDIRGDAA